MKVLRLTEQEQMERDRDEAAMGYLSPDAMTDLATKALLRSYGIAKTDPKRAWEFAQFAADMLRASMPAKEVA